jgi:hypothetical protein
MDLASDAKGTAAYDSCANSRYEPQKFCSVNVGGMVCEIGEVMVVFEYISIDIDMMTLTSQS